MVMIAIIVSFRENYIEINSKNSNIVDYQENTVEQFKYELKSLFFLSESSLLENDACSDSALRVHLRIASYPYLCLYCNYIYLHYQSKPGGSNKAAIFRSWYLFSSLPDKFLSTLKSAMENKTKYIHT